PCPVKKEVSKLRWLASSSTMRTRGSLREVFPPSGAMASNPGHELEMSNAENRTAGFVAEAFDLPAVSEDILANDGEAETGAFLMGGNVRFENLGALTGRDARPIIPDLEEGLGGSGLADDNLDFAFGIDRLDGVHEEVKKRLAEQLFIRFDRQLIAEDLELDALFLDVIRERADDFLNDRTESDGGTTDFAGSREVDEFIELGRDAIGFLDNLERFPAHFGGGLLLFGNHLSEAANDIERITGLVSQAGGSEVHLLEVGVQFTGTEQAHFQFGRLPEVTPGQTHADDRDAGKTADNHAHPKILITGAAEVFGRKADGEAEKATSLEQRFKLLVAHSGRTSPARRPVGRIEGGKVRGRRRGDR